MFVQYQPTIPQENHSVHVGIVMVSEWHPSLYFYTDYDGPGINVLWHHVLSEN